MLVQSSSGGKGTLEVQYDTILSFCYNSHKKSIYSLHFKREMYEVRQMFDEMAAMQQAYLPPFINPT
jgi:hypothetical protein